MNPNIISKTPLKLAVTTEPAFETQSLVSAHPSIHLPTHTNIVPIITPLDNSGSPVVDQILLSKYLTHLKKLGNQHLFALGETGEFRFLSNAQRIKFAEELIPAAKKLGLNVYINATAEDYKTSIENYKRFVALGADAIIFAPMWGDNQQTIQDLKDGKFIDGPPIILYNNPGITNGRNIAAGDIRKVAPFIGGLKDSSGQEWRAETYRQCLNCSLRGAPKLYIGDEFLAVKQFKNTGVDGCVGSSGVVSNLLTNLYSSEFQLPTLPDFTVGFIETVSAISDGRKKIVSGLKEILMLEGVIPHSRLAAGNEDNEQTEAGRAALSEIVKGRPSWLGN